MRTFGVSSSRASRPHASGPEGPALASPLWQQRDPVCGVGTGSVVWRTAPAPWHRRRRFPVSGKIWRMTRQQHHDCAEELVTEAEALVASARDAADRGQEHLLTEANTVAALARIHATLAVGSI
jgi:hypothetical protein